MIYSLHEGRIPTYNDRIPKIEAIYNEGTYIKDCSFLITEEICVNSFYNEEFIRQTAILEGAKMDMLLKNFLKEGKDYKGLKKDLNQIIVANNMDKSQLASKGKGLIHICKRILQVCIDIDAAIGAAAAPIGVAAMIGLTIVSGGGAVAIVSLISYIVALVVNFIINRLLRLLYDTVEFNTIKKDAEDIVDDLRSKANSAENEQLAKKFNSEADKLEAAIKKWSAKSNKKD